MTDNLNFPHKPTEIRLKREDRILEVDFDDGAQFAIRVELLRVESPSAEVQGHGPHQKTLIAGRRHVNIMEIVPVGNYAVTIKFDDMHDTGIYSWETLYRFGRDGEQMWADYLTALEEAGLSRDP